MALNRVTLFDFEPVTEMGRKLGGGEIYNLIHFTFLNFKREFLPRPDLIGVKEIPDHILDTVDVGMDIFVSEKNIRCGLDKVVDCILEYRSCRDDKCGQDVLVCSVLFKFQELRQSRNFYHHLYSQRKC